MRTHGAASAVADASALRTLLPDAPDACERKSVARLARLTTPEGLAAHQSVLDAAQAFHAASVTTMENEGLVPLSRLRSSTGLSPADILALDRTGHLERTPVVFVGANGGPGRVRLAAHPATVKAVAPDKAHAGRKLSKQLALQKGKQSGRPREYDEDLVNDVRERTPTQSQQQIANALRVSRGQVRRIQAQF